MPERKPPALTVYVVRHAHASPGKDDAARPLSRIGRGQMRQMGKFLRKRGLLAAREFWHSPLVRSGETAQCLAKHLKRRVTFNQREGLLHDDPPAIMARQLERVREPVAVVGHEPHLGALLSLLVNGAAKPVRFELQKGAVVALHRDRGRWLIQWHLAPEMLRKS
ncbi:MAG TPA: histidine phosphatase family protein [Lacunisphaera sp.]|nr:histidine phosphatase family protein [Lacunisphaera sp.]